MLKHILLSLSFSLVLSSFSQVWQEDQTIIPNINKPEDQIGSSTAIFKNFMVVGAKGDDEKATNAGSVYFYKKIDNRWEEIQKITASDASKEHNFGKSLAMTKDLLVIGALGSVDNVDIALSLIHI